VRVRLFTANVGLAVLVAIDVPLVAAAVHHGQGPGLSSDLTTVADSVASTPTSPAAAVSPVRPVWHPVTLSVSSAADGWRARVGCKQAPHLEATTDGGRTWAHVKVPTPHVLRVNQTGTGSGWIVGADASCTPSFFSTVDGGTTWTAAAGLGQAWVVIGRQLRLPNGRLVEPCQPPERLKGLAAASVTAALIVCGDRLLATADGGLNWQPAARLPGGGRAVAVALVPAGDGQGVALVGGAAGCDGLLAVRTSDSGATWRGHVCLPQLQVPAAVAVAADGAGFALAGDRAVRTPDGGRTWGPA
jgi:hypothetical protein